MIELTNTYSSEILVGLWTPATPPSSNRRFIWFNYLGGFSSGDTGYFLKYFSMVLNDNGDVDAYREETLTIKVGAYASQAAYIGNNCWVVSGSFLHPSTSTAGHGYDTSFYQHITKAYVIRVNEDATITIIDTVFLPGSRWFYHPNSGMMRRCVCLTQTTYTSLYPSGEGGENYDYKEITVSSSGFGSLVNKTGSMVQANRQWVIISDYSDGTIWGLGGDFSASMTNLVEYADGDPNPSTRVTDLSTSSENPFYQIGFISAHFYLPGDKFLYRANRPGYGYEWGYWTRTPSSVTTRDWNPYPEFPIENPPIALADPNFLDQYVYPDIGVITARTEPLLEEFVPFESVYDVWLAYGTESYPEYSEFEALVIDAYGSTEAYLELFNAQSDGPEVGTVAMFRFGDRTVYGETNVTNYYGSVFLKLDIDIWYTVDSNGRILQWSYEEEVPGWSPHYEWTRGENNL